MAKKAQDHSAVPVNKLSQEAAEAELILLQAQEQELLRLVQQVMIIINLQSGING